MTHHDLKIDPPFFREKAEGRKPWEIRSTTDRSFAVGDTVTFFEFDRGAGKYSGQFIGPEEITFVLVSHEAPLRLQHETAIFSHTSRTKIEMVP
jgi:hypothetical protein